MLQSGSPKEASDAAVENAGGAAAGGVAAVFVIVIVAGLLGGWYFYKSKKTKGSDIAGGPEATGIGRKYQKCEDL
eukprot:CAMPEP_0115600810 /NCGR_PEP_ID=MMETSP0272-20121206/15079_1 /TAXON_ID=71861 /ORGANISM="Scrippsiella trochoidea, Strain CCMP3099" /LENGTH=74 /DNA_ID=CAMNT_0003036263 /DNA_START=12 /DNA_END=236 /DNA_ORIENTATION=+